MVILKIQNNMKELIYKTKGTTHLKSTSATDW